MCAWRIIRFRVLAPQSYGVAVDGGRYDYWRTGGSNPGIPELTAEDWTDAGEILVELEGLIADLRKRWDAGERSEDLYAALMDPNYGTSEPRNGTGE